MELKIYFRMLLKRWRIVALAFLITFVAAAVFTLSQTPVYRSASTFVVAPAASVGVTGSVTVIDTVSRRPEIASTYAETAVSRKIKREALEALSLPLSQEKELVVKSKLRPGTNVLEISVEGKDPVLISNFANKVGSLTVAYVEKLYEAYGLNALDAALPPQSPIRPSKMLNLALGSVLGLALGCGLAFLAEYLATPLESMTDYNILDTETGTYNARYFAQRLGEEMSRAKRNKYPLSLALMDVDPTDVMSMSLSPELRSEALRKIAVLLKHSLREEDVLARLDGHVFALLLPDMPGEKVEAVLQEMQTKVAWEPLQMENGGVKLNVSGAAGMATYQYNGTKQDEFLAQALRALQGAAATGNGKVHQLNGNGHVDNLD